MEEVGIISPQHVDKILRLKPMVKWVCIAQTAEGVIGGAHVRHASSATNKIQEGLDAVCSDPTVLGEIESHQPGIPDQKIRQDSCRLVIDGIRTEI